MRRLMLTGVRSALTLWRREWRFLLCFALAAYVAAGAVDFLNRAHVYHCVGEYRCR